MEAVSVQHLFHSNGKFNVFAWILFIVTVLAFVFVIYSSYLQITKLKHEEGAQMKKLKEIELNLRAIRGNQYQQLI